MLATSGTYVTKLTINYDFGQIRMHPCFLNVPNIFVWEREGGILKIKAFPEVKISRFRRFREEDILVPVTGSGWIIFIFNLFIFTQFTFINISINTMHDSDNKI